MKKITYIVLALVLFIGINKGNAQASQDCEIKYSLFKGDHAAKNYDRAYDNWMWVMDNCPTLSVNTYKLGIDIAKHKYKTDKVLGVKLIKRVYEQRLKNFPKKDPAKVYSDWATWLAANGGSETEIFNLLEKSFNADVTKISAKNLYKYFDIILQRNKDTNVQKVLDTYDDVMDGAEKKTARYQGYMTALNAKKEAGNTLSSKEAKKLRISEKVLSNLGKIKLGLDGKIESLLTCERLIPLYRRDFDANRSNAQWLKRSVSRLHNKGCKTDPLYEQLVKAYAQAAPSADSYSFLASVLERNGKSGEAAQMRTKSFELETDPYKKAKYKLSFAQTAKDRGQKSKARSLAREALSLNPSYGRAYLFIAGLYASSANACGNDAFSKRMVYVAALAKARKAKQVDPSIGPSAQRMINSYQRNVPSKKDIFEAGKTSGGSHRVGCWIGESVRIP